MPNSRSFSRNPREACCCCIEIPTGVKIIGWIQIILFFIGLIFMMNSVAEGLFFVIISIAPAIAYLMMLRKNCRRTRRNLFLAYSISQFFAFFYGVIVTLTMPSFIIKICNRNEEADPKNYPGLDSCIAGQRLSLMLILIFNLLICMHYTAVIYLYYKKALRDESQNEIANALNFANEPLTSTAQERPRRSN